MRIVEAKEAAPAGPLRRAVSLDGGLPKIVDHRAEDGTDDFFGASAQPSLGVGQSSDLIVRYGIAAPRPAPFAGVAPGLAPLAGSRWRAGRRAH